MYLISKNTPSYFLSVLLLFTSQTQSMDYLRGMYNKETFKAMAYVVGGIVVGSIGQSLLSSSRDSLFASKIKMALNSYLIESRSHKENDLKRMSDNKYVENFSEALQDATHWQNRKLNEKQTNLVCDMRGASFDKEKADLKKENSAKKPPVSRPPANQVNRNNPTFGDQVRETMNASLAANGVQMNACEKYSDDDRLQIIKNSIQAAAEHNNDCKPHESHAGTHQDIEDDAGLGPLKERKLDMDPSLDITVRDFLVENERYSAKDAKEASNNNILGIVKEWEAAAKEYEEAKSQWERKRGQWKYKAEQVESHSLKHYGESLKFDVDCDKCGWKPTPYKPEDL